MDEIDLVNSHDPNCETYEGKSYPKEVLYSRRMTGWLFKICEKPSEELEIATRAQHIARWTIPRSDFADGTAGYHQWRSTLAKFHAQKISDILNTLGYETEFITRVKSIVQKEGLKSNSDAQTLEDCACLVFLENHFTDLSKKQEEDKMVEIVRKTWLKMSPKAQQLALGLNLSEDNLKIISKALTPTKE